MVYVTLDSPDLEGNWSILCRPPCWGCSQPEAAKSPSSLLWGPPGSLRDFQSQTPFPSSRQSQLKSESLLGACMSVCLRKGNHPSVSGRGFGPTLSLVLSSGWLHNTDWLSKHPVLSLHRMYLWLPASSLRRLAQEDGVGSTHHTHFPS